MTKPPCDQPARKSLVLVEFQVAQHRAACGQKVVGGLLVARFHHVALGLGGDAEPEIVGADQQVALARELRDHELGFGRLIGEGRHLLLSVHGTVLIGDHGKAGILGVGHRQQAAGDHRLVVALGRHRGIGDAVQPDCISGRRIGDGDPGEFRGVDLQDLVQPFDVPTVEIFVAHAARDLDWRLVLRAGDCRHGAREQQRGEAEAGLDDVQHRFHRGLGVPSPRVGRAGRGCNHRV